MKYNWKLLENGAQFETLTELEQQLVDSGHENYPEEKHPIAYIGKEPWEQKLYSEVESQIGKDTWVCDETTDEFKAKYGLKPKSMLGGEFSLEDAGKYCKDKPRLRVPEQFEFEKALVLKWMRAAGKEDGRGRNPNSIGNLKQFRSKDPGPNTET